jgi:general stress protein 26
MKSSPFERHDRCPVTYVPSALTGSKDRSGALRHRKIWIPIMEKTNEMIGTVPRSSTSDHGAGKATISHEALSILRDSREATLATLRPDGWPQATVINFVNDEQQIYFACAASSQKAQNLERDDRISLALVAPYAVFGPIFGLSLAGHARRMGKAEDIAHMFGLWKIRHPYNHQRLEADRRSFAFYAVEPIVVTTLDYRSALGQAPQNRASSFGEP